MSDAGSGFLREALFNGNGIARKLIIALVLFSSFITAAITAIELYGEYRRDLAQIDQSIEFIGQSYLPSLVDSVWVADHGQVQTQLDGLLRLPDVEYLGISVDGRTRWAAGEAVSRRTVTAEVPLVREHRGQALTIGTLQVIASVDRVLARIWDQLLLTLVSNGIKTLLVAGFMLLVFQLLVTRHLSRIAAFVRAIDPADPRGEQVRLDRPDSGRWRPDILDAVASAINRLSESLSEAMRHLRASDERLRALTRETTAFIYELDRDGRITFVNRPFAGLARERIEGSLLVDWFPASLRPRIAEAVTAAIDAGTPQRLEYSTTDRKDRAHAYVTTITPIARDGVVASAALTAVDITELKAAEQKIVELNASLERRVDERTAELQSAMERAESASRAKSEFLSRMSHELRTPLNAIIGFAQIIELSAPTPKQLQWAGAIRRAGDHLLQMIDDLLDLARIDIGKLAIRIEPVDLAPIVGESLAMVRPMVNARGLRLIEECRGELRVLADPLRLRQIVVNLLSNAVKYNREQGTVTIRSERRGDRVRLSVADTGIGIDAQKLHRLFQPFERLGAEARDVEGTGIGLALSKQLATLMGAEVGADSEPGVGSVFWIDVQGADILRAEEPAQRAAELSLGAAALDVLYVEDKVSNIDLIAAYLALYPSVRLRTALTGEAGLALARERRPDVVLLDIHLPGGMDGFQVLQAMRADGQLRDIPVIGLSADAMPADIQRARAAGFARYIAKPVRLNELLQAFAAILADAPEARAAP